MLKVVAGVHVGVVGVQASGVYGEAIVLGSGPEVHVVAETVVATVVVVACRNGRKARGVVSRQIIAHRTSNG